MSDPGGFGTLVRGFRLSMASSVGVESVYSRSPSLAIGPAALLVDFDRSNRPDVSEVLPAADARPVSGATRASSFPAAAGNALVDERSADEWPAVSVDDHTERARFLPACKSKFPRCHKLQR